MSSQLQARRQLLRDLYGFDFPEDLFRFWAFANKLRPLEPLNALLEPLGIQLVGPFDVLAGRCDLHRPRLSMLLHWRYHEDPPEFFTVLAGEEEGLHWGYYLDDPLTSPPSVASYFAREEFDLSSDGDSLFEAVRLHLEYIYLDGEELIAEDPERATEYRDEMRTLDRLRDALMVYETSERPEQGNAYVERYDNFGERATHIVAMTAENMGIVVPPEKHRRVRLAGTRYWPYLKNNENPIRAVEAARRALEDGFPGTALKVGKDLWAIGGRQRTDYAYELLDGAYAALDREFLRHVLQTHRENRELPTIDLFEYEKDKNGHI